MLGATGGRQAVWLRSLDLGEDVDLLSLLHTVDDRTPAAVALHTEVQASLVTAMIRVEEAQQLGDVVVAGDGTILRDSPSRELEAAQAVLVVAQGKLLSIPDVERQQVVTQAKRAIQDRWAAQQRCVTLISNGYEFKVRVWELA